MSPLKEREEVKANLNQSMEAQNNPAIVVKGVPTRINFNGTRYQEKSKSKDLTDIIELNRQLA